MPTPASSRGMRALDMVKGESVGVRVFGEVGGDEMVFGACLRSVDGFRRERSVGIKHCEFTQGLE